MNVLILGGSGFLGSYLTQEFASRGINVSATTTRENIELELDNVKWYRLNVLELGYIESSLDHVNPDLIVNCIALSDPKDCENNPQMAWALNAGFVEHLVGLCRKREARLIQISTDHVFDRLGGGCDEDTVPDAYGDLGYTKIYGEEKVVEAQVGTVVRLSELWGKPLLSGHKTTIPFIFFEATESNKHRPSLVDNQISPSSVGQVAVSLVDFVMSEEEIPILHITEGNIGKRSSFLREMNISEEFWDVNLEELSLGLTTKYPKFSQKLDLMSELKTWIEELT